MTIQNKEKLTVQINNKKVKIDHNWDTTTGRSLHKQTTGLKELKSFLFDEIVFQKKESGFIPYNNFESGVNWKIVKEENNENKHTN